MKTGRQRRANNIGLADIPTGQMVQQGAGLIGSLIPIPGAGPIIGEIGSLVSGLLAGKPSGDPAFATFNFQNGMPVFAYLHNEEGKTNSDTNTQAMGMVTLIQKLASLVQLRGGTFNPPNSAMIFEFSAQYPTRVCFRPAGSTTACQWQDVGNPGDATGGASAIWNILRQYATVDASDLSVSAVANAAGGQPAAQFAPPVSAVPGAPAGAYPTAPGANGAAPYSSTPGTIAGIPTPLLLIGGGLLLASLFL